MYEGYSYGDATKQYCLLARPSSLNFEEREALNAVLEDYSDAFQARMRYLFDFIPVKSQAIHELEALLARDPSLSVEFSHAHLANLIFYSQGAPFLRDLEPIDEKAILDELLLGYSELFKEFIYYICRYSDTEPELFKKLTNLLNENQASYSNEFTCLDFIQPILNEFTESDIERLQILKEKSLPRFSYSHLRDVVIETLLLSTSSLHFAPARILGRPLSLDILSRVLPYIPEELRSEAVKIVGVYGLNALHNAAGNARIFNRIINALPEKQRLTAIETLTENGQTLLDRVLNIKNTDILKIILMIYPEDKRYDIVKPYLENDFSHFHSSCFLVMLEVISEDHRHQFFDDDILYTWCVYKGFFSIIQNIFALLPKGKSTVEIMTKTHETGYSILDKSLDTDNSEDYLRCLKLFPIEQRINFLDKKRFWINAIYRGDSIGTLAAVSSMLQPKDFVRILQHPFEKKTIVIAYLEYFEHYQQDCFYRILDMLPSELKVEATKITLLNSAEYSPKILKSFAAIIPDIYYIELFSKKDETETMSFFSAIQTPEILANILKALPHKISRLIFIDDIKKAVSPLLGQIEIYNKEALAKLMSEIQLSQDLPTFCNHIEKLSLAIQEDNRSKIEQRLIVRNNERRLIVRDQENADVFFKIKGRIASDRNSDITESNNHIKPSSSK